MDSAVRSYRQRRANRIYSRLDANDIKFIAVGRGNHKHIVPINREGKIQLNGAGDKKLSEAESKPLNEIKKHTAVNVSFKTVNPKEFKGQLLKAKNSIKENDRWRVSSEYSEDDYKNCKLFYEKSGATVAVTKDGDIISVCKYNGSKVTGSQLIQHAVKMGGKKLDAYEGIYDFYVKNGFEPVSWCKWSDDFAPEDWKKANKNGANVEREDIIFFKYTGNKTHESLQEFKNRVKSSNDYDEAMNKRDVEIK